MVRIFEQALCNWGKLAIIGLLMGWIPLAGPLNGEAKASRQRQAPLIEHLVGPGDSWQALAWRYDLPKEKLFESNRTPNPFRSPAIGSTVMVPSTSGKERTGSIVRLVQGGPIYLAVSRNMNPWKLAFENRLWSPFSPLVQRPIFLSVGNDPPQDLPHRFNTLETSSLSIEPGRAFAIRALVENVQLTPFVAYGTGSMSVFVKDGSLIGLAATGAFFEPGDYDLRIATGDFTWSQPWRMAPGHWDFDEITLTGSAAQIDQASIIAERERLDQIWQVASPEPEWNHPFQAPLEDYLSISSTYGARRSYNGGPYRTYHEGLDFSAYGGTTVFASGDGRVVLAEQLYVRGGAVIIDHGLGVFSGYYHLSEITVTSGAEVSAGDVIGKVGSTGLSTGNHLHWDLLAGGTWVDPQSWLTDNLACWLLEGWAKTCAT